jgi:hypothetical protein
MRTVVFHDLFGGWGWEQIDEHGRVCAESAHPFDSEEECLEDARRCGRPGIFDVSAVTDVD